ncbi:MAG: UvrD-helicase domain-containing protein [Candidatus Riflebacteria bacterium]|nr:UvrD-helicase domain-containing protein [Candidatus Riflebacteria bacterium]
MKHTPAQLQAINSDSKAILVIAGAGSGKTATTISRIVRLVEQGTNPASILCLTFTRKAANEVKERLAKKIGESAAKKVWAGTFHAISYRILMQWGSKIGYQTNSGRAITVVTPEDSDELLKRIMKAYDYRGTAKSLNEAKSILAHDGTEPEDLNIKRIIAEYHARLKECNAVDFDQLLLEVQKLFEVCPDALEFYRTKFQHIFVDEYQDTDKVQYNLHEVLTPKHLFCVGDSDQAIYGWRGANVGIILNFEKDHPGAEIIKLEHCFRCADEIVSRANSLIEKNRDRIEKTLIGATGKEGVFESTTAMAEDLAFYIAEYMPFENPGEIAVIARTHRTLEKIEHACKKMNLDVLRVGKATAELEEDDTFKFMYAMLRLQMNPHDNMAFLTANKIGFKEDMKEVWKHANEQGCSWYQASKSKIPIAPEEGLVVFYNECCNVLGQFNKSTFDYFFENWLDTTAEEWLETYQLKDSHLELEKKIPDTITLITAHASKGLEWNNVLIADFNENSFPSKMALREGHLEEERRLAYVAFTRARTRLLIFHNPEKEASRFIAESQPTMKIAIVDIETTGFMPKGLILEVGIAELDLKTGNVTPIYDKLVKEEGFGEEHKNSWIFKNSDLKFEEITEAEPLNVPAIQEILNNYPATAFNKRFDFGFLRPRGLKINELDCPMLLATNICKLPGKFGKHKWPTVEEAWKHFFPNEPYSEKHRGADDALHEAKIVYELYKMGVFKVPQALPETKTLEKEN